MKQFVYVYTYNFEANMENSLLKQLNFSYNVFYIRWELSGFFTETWKLCLWNE